MEQYRYLIALVSIFLLGFGVCVELPAFEKNYLYQAEDNVLLDYWDEDMVYIDDFLKNATLTPYEHIESSLVRCQFHEFHLESIKLNTENVLMSFDPDNYVITFYQPDGFDWQIDLVWEYNLLYFPITGTASFSGEARDFTYKLNITQPFVGKMFIPSVDWKWKVTSSKIDSPLGTLLGIQAVVEKTFAEVLAGPLMDELHDGIRDVIPLKYEEYYAPQPDFITFSGLNDQQLEVMRRYKNVFMNKHILAIGYKETVEHATSKPKAQSKAQPKSIRRKHASIPIIDDGILRRYYREFSIFEQIATKILTLIQDYKITNSDLPIKQEMRLEPDLMQLMLPDFKLHYAKKVNISLVVTGKLGKVGVYAASTQTMMFNNLVFEMSFYANDSKENECFLTTSVAAAIGLKPISSWKGGNLVINMEIQSVSTEVISAESKIFKTIMTKGIKEFTQQGMMEFLTGKCKSQMLGDGLKIRDELSTYENVTTLQDISGNMLNIWIYQAF